MTKRVESLRAPCLDASSTLATSTFEKSDLVALFSFRWLGRSTGGVSGDLSAWWLLFAVANSCLYKMLCLKMNFRHCIF